MAINHPDWNAVRQAVAAGEGETLFRRTVQTVYDESGEAKEVVGFEPVPQDASAKASFERIEEDVARLIQEIESYQIVERELRTALEEPGGAEVQRR